MLCGMLLMPILAQLTPALSLLPSGWRWQPHSGSRIHADQETIATKPNLSRQPTSITAHGRAATGDPAW